MKNSRTSLFSVCLAVSVGLFPILSSAQGQEPTKKPVDFDKEIVPIIKANCISCHNSDVAKHNVAFPDKMTLEDAKKNARLWRRAAKEIKSGHMPPKGNGSMKDSEKKTFQRWYDETFPKPKTDPSGPATTGGGATTSS